MAYYRLEWLSVIVRYDSSSPTQAYDVAGKDKHNMGNLMQGERKRADSHRELPHNFSKWLILIDVWKIQLPFGLPSTRAPR